MRKYFILFSMLFIFASVWLFMRSQPNDQSTVMMIGNYRMTVDDLKREWMSASYAQNSVVNVEDLLEIARLRQVMVMEAQRRKLHHRESFRQRIEYFWKESLIAELQSELILELQKEGSVSDLAVDQLKEKYDELLADVNVVVNRKAFEKVLKDIQKQQAEGEGHDEE